MHHCVCRRRCSMTRYNESFYNFQLAVVCEERQRSATKLLRPPNGNIQIRGLGKAEPKLGEWTPRFVDLGWPRARRAIARRGAQPHDKGTQPSGKFQTRPQMTPPAWAAGSEGSAPTLLLTRFRRRLKFVWLKETKLHGERRPSWCFRMLEIPGVAQM